jgi:hypothetical protein
MVKLEKRNQPRGTSASARTGLFQEARKVEPEKMARRGVEFRARAAISTIRGCTVCRRGDEPLWRCEV